MTMRSPPGDEEMMQYIKRQQAKKLANGATQEELDDMLKLPSPSLSLPCLRQLPKASLLFLLFVLVYQRPCFLAAVFKSSQIEYLSDYERKEILDYDNVYFIGAHSQKKLATLDNSTNNYGYGDDRDDYLVVNHDRLAYRYEVVSSLGKSSFGRVLRCRDHRTGESVAIKIIRNKKRFHH
jgi:dual specificity tyrosine-phosphorylation-regulated kinase 2/3/4